MVCVIISFSEMHATNYPKLRQKTISINTVLSLFTRNISSTVNIYFVHSVSVIIFNYVNEIRSLNIKSSHCAYLTKFNVRVISAKITEQIKILDIRPLYNIVHKIKFTLSFSFAAHNISTEFEIVINACCIYISQMELQLMNVWKKQHRSANFYHFD